MCLDIGVALRYGEGVSKSFISAHRSNDGLCAMPQIIYKLVCIKGG